MIRAATPDDVDAIAAIERAVFEAHPENRAPYDVLLSLVGVFSLTSTYPIGVPDQRANCANPR